MSLGNAGLNGVGTGVFLVGADQVYKGSFVSGIVLLVAGLLVLAAYEYTPTKATPVNTTSTPAA